MIQNGGIDLAYTLHEVEFEIDPGPGYYSDVLDTYVQECSEWCYFPVDGNTNTNSVARGFRWPNTDSLGDTGSGAGNTAIAGNVQRPVYYTCNDQTYNAVRYRLNIGSLPAGRYKLKFYGIAK